MEFIGITSCATGIAHSYMAAESLENIAKKLGMQSKVEIQGALGIENKIKPNELKNARVIIFANDVSISEVGRFKPFEEITIHTSPHDVIRHPEKVIAQIQEKLVVQ